MGWGFLAALFATSAALAFTSAGAQAQGIGLPECSDLRDNDGNGLADFPVDPGCSSSLDQNEGIGNGGDLDDLFVTFLTQWDDPDPEDDPDHDPDVVCQYSILAAVGTEIAQVVRIPVDVNQPALNPRCTGSSDIPGLPSADISVGVRVPLSGDTKQPTIRVDRTVGGTLPVKVEVVEPDKENPRQRDTVGYDALTSATGGTGDAPTTFTAALDLRDQDGREDTDDIEVTQTLAGPPSQLAFVADTFTAATEDLTERRNLKEHRVNFRSSGGTQVPTQVNIDLSVGERRQRVELTRNQPTVMDFLIGRPNDDPKITGTLDKLPPEASVTVDNADTDGDKLPDQNTITYDADEPVDLALVNAETVRRLPKPEGVNQKHAARPDPCHVTVCGPPKRIRLLSRIDDLPGDPADDEDAKVVYTDGDKKDLVDYRASDRLSFARLIANDEAPLIGPAHHVNLRLTDVPPELHAEVGRGKIKLDALGDQIGLFQLTAAIAQPGVCIPTVQNPCTVPTDDRFTFVDDEDSFNLEARVYRLKSADVTLDPPLTVKLDTGPEMVDPGGCGEPVCKRGDLVPVWRTPLDVTIDVPRGADDEVALSRDPQCADGEDNDDDGAADFPKDESCNSRLDATEDGQQLIEARIRPLEPIMRLQLAKNPNDDKFFLYEDRTPEGAEAAGISLDGTNMSSLPTGKAGQEAKDLHLTLQGLPRELSIFNTKQAGLNLVADRDVGGSRSLGKLELQMTSGPDERLPESDCVGEGQDCDYRVYDGLYMRDLTDRFVIHARLRDLKSARINKRKERGVAGVAGDRLVDTLTAGIDHQTRVTDLALKIDVEERKGLDTPTISDNRIDTMDAELADLPADIRMKAGIHPEEVGIEYEASEDAGPFEVDRTKRFLNNQSFRDEFENLKLTPLPQELEICRVSKGDACTSDILVTKREAEVGSLKMFGSRRFAFHYGKQAPQLGDFTVVDLDIRHLLALEASGESSGYLAMDTGWSAPVNPGSPHSHPAPVADQAIDGHIRIVKSPRHITDFDFGNGLFAAQGRFLTWQTHKQLYFNCTTHGCTDNVGHTYCPPGLDFFIARPADSIKQQIVEGDVVEFGLEGKFCGADNFGQITPGVD